MLTVLLIAVMFGQGLSWDEMGLKFITLFPENIAFYYPVDPVNSLNITAVVSKASVTVTVQDSSWTYTTSLTPGKPQNIALPAAVEEYRFGITSRTVTISSNDYIVVQSISQRGDSVQTNVVPPQKNTGTYFILPPLNYTQMMNTFFPAMSNISKRYSSFRLVIINSDVVDGYVTIKTKSTALSYIIGYRKALQLQMDGTEMLVSSNVLVIVMLTHPCVETAECRCNMMVNPVIPKSQFDSRFVVPSIANISNAWLHVTSMLSNTSNSLPTLQSKPLFVDTTALASLKLIAPGFIIESIPHLKFSACYLVHVTSAEAQALVIAETDSRDSVYVDGDLLSSTQWSAIADSQYSWVLMPLDATHVIWHPSTLIAVFVFEKSTNIYEGSAICLSSKPDPLGCALFPSSFKIVSTQQTWPESHQNCLDVSDELFTPSNKAAHMEMVNFLNGEDVKESLWIGLRRSLLTLDWYRQMGKTEHELVYTQWGRGEPRDPVEGMCVSVFPNSSMGFQWENQQCCSPLKSLCYKRAVYFPLYFPISDSKLSDNNSGNNNQGNGKKPE